MCFPPEIRGRNPKNSFPHAAGCVRAAPDMSAPARHLTPANQKPPRLPAAASPPLTARHMAPRCPTSPPGPESPQPAPAAHPTPPPEPAGRPDPRRPVLPCAAARRLIAGLPRHRRPLTTPRPTPPAPPPTTARRATSSSPADHNTPRRPSSPSSPATTTATPANRSPAKLVTRSGSGSGYSHG